MINCIIFLELGIENPVSDSGRNPITNSLMSSHGNNVGVYFSTTCILPVISLRIALSGGSLRYSFTIISSDFLIY